jgi:hypothetical protein
VVVEVVEEVVVIDVEIKNSNRIVGNIIKKKEFKENIENFTP